MTEDPSPSLASAAIGKLKNSGRDQSAPEKELFEGFDRSS
jgi:hypothetical protein